MEHVNSIIHAKWIIPVEPDQTVYENHSMTIKNGRIHSILPTDETIKKYTSQEITTLSEHALIPGFVNTHTHAAMSLFRGLADDLPLMTWLNEHIWPAEAAWVNYDFVQDGTQLAIAEMLRSGTTCFSDMYFFPDEVARAASEYGIRAAVGIILIDFPTIWAKDTDEYFQKGLDVREYYRNDPLISFTFAPHAPYTVSDEPLKRTKKLSEELNLPIHIHVQETEDEIAQSMTQHNERPLKRLVKLDLLSPKLLAVHMTQLTSTEIEQLAINGCHVIHCPESNLKLASGFCPVVELMKANVNVALGTDSAASNNDLCMLSEMRTAALLAKAVAKDAAALPAHSALRMATLNGAKALGLENEIGSLILGKAADMVAINLGELESQPVYDPISQIVYTANRNQVTDVWVAGKTLLKNRTLTTMDITEIKDKTIQWKNKIAAACR
ncbi:S-adenosylhomocysteine deaminase; Methylthioadenosine deaminase [hydrothermal vent metagenome]|uniref:S-adenosylhomocysteine deaminase Methylthioadenosine deaminase n=1 Tax=hydrothermal vent metagenome TaxID=652676 RepID=A0A3B0ZVL0_9ZZZZ